MQDPAPSPSPGHLSAPQGSFHTPSQEPAEPHSRKPWQSSRPQSSRVGRAQSQQQQQQQQQSHHAETPAASATANSSIKQPKWWKVHLFRGMIKDIKRRAPYYWSDWIDAWDYRVVPATVYMFFAKCVSRPLLWKWYGLLTELVVYCLLWRFHWICLRRRIRVMG